MDFRLDVSNLPHCESSWSGNAKLCICARGILGGERRPVRQGRIASGGKTFTVVCIEEPKTEEEAERILKAAQTKEWSVLSVNESEQARSPRPPFTTSTLQQAASTRLGLSPSRTMGIAQKLYESGYITYMRTDSTNLSKEAQDNLVAAVRSEFGEKYIEARVYKTKSKSAQEAHEAVRPTDPNKHSFGHNEEQKKLYALIRARALASQMADASMLRTKILANVLSTPLETGESSAIPDFAANGSRVIFDGWLASDPDARGEDTQLPKVEKEILLHLSRHTLKARKHNRQAYSEAGLVKELEKRGIGRPSTYASTIRT